MGAPEGAESLRNSDALMRVAVPRRRGPAGLRDPIAVSLAALMGFSVLLSRFVGTQKIERLFFSYSGAFFEPLFASIHARNLSFGTTIRLPILSAGKPLLRVNSYAPAREIPSTAATSVTESISGSSS